MKYRVRVDLSFDPQSVSGQADAQSLFDYARMLTEKAVNINEGQSSEDASFCEIELCRHDEGLPCTRLDRIEVMKSGGERL